MAAAAVFVAALVRDVFFLALFLLAPPLLRAAPDFLAEDFLPAPELRFRLDFRADDLRAVLRADDFRAELERPPDLRERERLPPLFFRPPDFLDVAMKRLRK